MSRQRTKVVQCTQWVSEVMLAACGCPYVAMGNAARRIQKGLDWEAPHGTTYWRIEGDGWGGLMVTGWAVASDACE